MRMTHTWAAIVRSSHLGGRGGETFHADKEQVADIERYAATHGAQVVFMEPELSVSGGLPIEKRPSLCTAIEGVERGQFNGIVVAYLSRLSRSRSGIEIWERVEAAGGHVHCAAENLDTSTPSGRFVRDIHLANAVREREEHAERHAKRRRKTVEAGIWRVRQVPRGLAFAGPADEEGRYRGRARRLIHGDDAPVVRQAFLDRRAGTPIVTIADRLKMTPSGVRQLLSNRIYLGELRDGENVNPGAVEPLIDPDTFDAVQVSIPRPGRTVGSGPALLAGLARCAGCGHVMSRQKTKSVVYSCHSRHSGGRCPAPAAITAALLDVHVEAIALAELERLRISTTERGDIDAARQALAAAERELAAYLEAVSAADIGAEAFGAGARRRRDAADGAREQLRRQLATQDVLPGESRGADAWQELDGHGRNALLRALLEMVIVTRAGGRGARTPVAARVSVIAHGAGLPVPGRWRAELLDLARLDVDDEHVLRMPGAENGLEGARGAGQVRRGA